MDEKEIKLELHYEQDSKRYHRYRIESEEGVKGSVYFPKDMDPIPIKVILERKD